MGEIFTIFCHEGSRLTLLSNYRRLIAIAREVKTQPIKLSFVGGGDRRPITMFVGIAMIRLAD
jgi:hypothetical protein